MEVSLLLPIIEKEDFNHSTILLKFFSRSSQISYKFHHQMNFQRRIKNIIQHDTIRSKRVRRVDF